MPAVSLFAPQADPKDADLGREIDPPGERLAITQRSGVPARYGGAPVGFCPPRPAGHPSPGAAYLPLPGSLSPARDAATLPGRSSRCRSSCSLARGPGGSAPASSALVLSIACCPCQGRWHVEAPGFAAEHSPDHSGPAALAPIKAIPTSKKTPPAFADSYMTWNSVSFSTTNSQKGE